MPDNSKIIFQYCEGERDAIAIYEIKSHKAYDYKEMNRVSDGFALPAYSRDGGKIAFFSVQGDNSNICVMNTNGSGVRQLTHDDNTKPVRDGNDFIIRRNAFPSFSPDGNRIIYMKSGVRRKRAFPLKGDMLSKWDVYEVDIRTGKERRLTNYRFYEISQPYYLPDGKQFIFSGNGPINHSGVGPKDFAAYEKLYQNNEIFIMDGINNALKPAFMNRRYSTEPHASWDNTILFLSITNEMDGLARNPYNYDLFIYKGGKIKRITRMQSYIFQPSISPDGSKAAFLVKKWGEDGYSLWVVNTDSTGLTKINIPWEQLEKGNKKVEK